MRAQNAVRVFERGEHPSIRSAISELIREEIVSGQLPAGARIPIKDIGLAFGVATSVVREALLHLAADGLAVAEEQRGFRVAPMSAEDLEDICGARIDVETFLILDAMRNGDAAWEARILASLHELLHAAKRMYDDETTINPVYAAHHRAFHETLASASRSQWMLRFYRTLIKHTDRYRQLLVTTHNQREIDDEHRELVAVVLRRDMELTRALIANHVNDSLKRLLESGAVTRKKPVEAAG